MKPMTIRRHAPRDSVAAGARSSLSPTSVVVAAQEICNNIAPQHRELENILEESGEEGEESLLYIYDDPESSYERSFEHVKKWPKGAALEEFDVAPRQLSFEEATQKEQLQTQLQQEPQHTTDELDETEVETVAESSVFGSLVESDLHNAPTITASGKDCRTPLYSPDILKQTRLERVLSKAATVMKKHDEQLETSGIAIESSSHGSYTSQSRTKNDDDSSTDDFTDVDSETMFNSILDVSTIHSHPSYTSRSTARVNYTDDVDDDPDSKSLASFLSSKAPSTSPFERVEKNEQSFDTQHDSTIDSAAFQSFPSSSPPLLSIQIQQELTALQRKKRLSQTAFQTATQGLQDDLHRSHTLVQTLEEQLHRAHQQREQALQRLQGASLKRDHQLQADSVRTLHLEIAQYCLSSEATRTMISAPMEGNRGSNESFGDGSVGTSNGMSILDKVMRLSTSTAIDECDYTSTTSSSSLVRTMYQHLSMEELQLIRIRLQAILELFETAQRRSESTNLRWQAQADAMKQDAASKYILYCRYGQL